MKNGPSTSKVNEQNDSINFPTHALLSHLSFFSLSLNKWLWLSSSFQSFITWHRNWHHNWHQHDTATIQAGRPTLHEFDSISFTHTHTCTRNHFSSITTALTFHNTDWVVGIQSHYTAKWKSKKRERQTERKWLADPIHLLSVRCN